MVQLGSSHQMPGNLLDSPAPPALSDLHSEAEVEQLSCEEGAGLATFLMTKAILQEAYRDTADQKPHREWTFKDIKSLPLDQQKE
jgi:hypothetical protein